MIDPVLAEAEALHARALAAVQTHRQSYYALATLLCEVADTGAHRVLGYARMADYAAATLELTSRKTRDLLAIGRRVRGLPEIAAAMSTGDLAWTKAREIVRVADPDTDGAWAAFAMRATTHQVEDRVARAAPGDTPEDAAGREDAPRGSMVRRLIELENTDDDVLSRALALIRARCGNADEVSDGSALAILARRFLEDAASEEKAPSGEPYRIVLRVCPHCCETTTVDGDPVSDTVAGEALCDCEVVNVTPGPEAGHMTRSVPDKLRRCVLDRDNYRCAVPGCCNRLWIDVHHLEPWAWGGKHEMRNLVVLCPFHHRLVHDGRLAVERAKDGRIEVRGPQMAWGSTPARAWKPAPLSSEASAGTA